METEVEGLSGLDLLDKNRTQWLSIEGKRGTEGIQGKKVR